MAEWAKSPLGEMLLQFDFLWGKGENASHGSKLFISP